MNTCHHWNLFRFCTFGKLLVQSYASYLTITAIVMDCIWKPTTVKCIPMYYNWLVSYYLYLKHYSSINKQFLILNVRFISIGIIREVEFLPNDWNFGCNLMPNNPLTQSAIPVPQHKYDEMWTIKNNVRKQTAAAAEKKPAWEVEKKIDKFKYFHLKCSNYWYVICFSPGGPGFKSRQVTIFQNKNERCNVWITTL